MPAGIQRFHESAHDHLIPLSFRDGHPNMLETGGSLHVATYANATTNFSHTDWTATERVRSAVNGTVAETCTNLPYGDDQQCSGIADPSGLHFTGKLRDAETGLDNFQARYYASMSGRWMLPDWSALPEPVPYASLDNPQTLNLYGISVRIGADSATNCAD